MAPSPNQKLPTKLSTSRYAPIRGGDIINQAKISILKNQKNCLNFRNAAHAPMEKVLRAMFYPQLRALNEFTRNN